AQRAHGERVHQRGHIPVELLKGRLLARDEVTCERRTHAAVYISGLVKHPRASPYVFPLHCNGHHSPWGVAHTITLSLYDRTLQSKFPPQVTSTRDAGANASNTTAMSTRVLL